MRKILFFIGSVLTTSTVLAADRPLSIWFEKSPEEVSSLIAGLCAERNAMIIEQDNYHVLCSREESGFKGALAQALIGNSYSTTPEVKVRFSIIKQENTVRVLASQWMETQMAFGQVRRVELNGRKNTDTMRDLLVGLGGSTTPPDPKPVSPP